MALPSAHGRLQLPVRKVSFFMTLKPRVERYTKSMSFKYEPSSGPLHISAKWLFFPALSVGPNRLFQGPDFISQNVFIDWF